jgi:N-acyl-D-amino-acid deacylase
MIADGSGGVPWSGSIGIRDGRIAAVGEISGRGSEEIDARDRLVTPGFVDIHTHYDGHATWANRLEPSSQHGVTTVVTGNCGVGFAPCRPEDRERLVKLMEGVEDIPEAVMSAGLPWNWRSFPEYLNALERRRFDIDVATQVPHAPLRVFVMGDRAIEREPATAADIAEMASLARQGIEAGALGFSTSRTLNHRASDGTVTYSYAAAREELVGIAEGVARAGKGVLQFISDFDDVDAEFGIVREMVRASRRPLSLSLMQMPNCPDRWREILHRVETAGLPEAPIRAQVCGRPVGVLMALDFSRNPFLVCPSYVEVLKLSSSERREALLAPERKSRILAEHASIRDDDSFRLLSDFSKMYELGEELDYEPPAKASLAARACAAGGNPAELAYDILVERGGVIYIPAANYTGNSMEAIRTLLFHPASVLGLGDGGAHCGMICDASLPTYMLKRWSRRSGSAEPADRVPVEQVVQALTLDTARAVGLYDRGAIRIGARADINVIDMDRIDLLRPQAVADLPDGAKRIGQGARGYDATIVAGVVTYRHGEATGALPGRLVRGTAGSA